MVEALRADDRIGPYIVLEDKILQHDACGTRCRPDLLLSCPWKLHILVECDEHEHSSYIAACEANRMDELIDELLMGRVIFIRWNPDSYQLPAGVLRRPLREERLQALCDLIVTLAQRACAPCDPPIEVHYMYYSADNPVIAHRFAPQLHY